MTYRLLVPLDLVQQLQYGYAQPVLELGPVQPLLGVFERRLAGARVEVVEAEDAGVHDFEEAEVVAPNGHERKVDGQRAVYYSNIPVLSKPFPGRGEGDRNPSLHASI